MIEIATDVLVAAACITGIAAAMSLVALAWDEMRDGRSRRKRKRPD